MKMKVRLHILGALDRAQLQLSNIDQPFSAARSKPEFDDSDLRCRASIRRSDLTADQSYIASDLEGRTSARKIVHGRAALKLVCGRNQMVTVVSIV